MPLIMVGQHLLSRHAEMRDDSEFEINLKAEQEIELVLEQQSELFEQQRTQLQRQGQLILHLLERLDQPAAPAVT